MYSFLHDLLSDKKGGAIFTLFGGWHVGYMAVTLVAVIAILCLLKRKSSDVKQRVTKGLCCVTFGLYMADFFLMPLAYGEIDIEKLPFHACTAMCVMCFCSYHNRFLAKFRMSFVFLGFISNLVYLIYPAGVMWHAVHPLSYRVIQTMTFHSLMTVYGCLMVIYERDTIRIRKCYQNLAVVIIMTLWAVVGNYVYNGVSEGYDHFFNWFFVVRDPFYLFPEGVAAWVMPFLNVALFFAAELLLYLVIFYSKRIKNNFLCHQRKEKNI